MQFYNKQFTKASQNFAFCGAFSKLNLRLALYNDLVSKGKTKKTKITIQRIENERSNSYEENNSYELINDHGTGSQRLRS